MISLKSFDVYSAAEVKALTAEKLNQLLDGFKPKKVLVLENPRGELLVSELVTAMVEQNIPLAEAIIEHNNLELTAKELEAFNTIVGFYRNLNKTKPKKATLG